MNHVLNSLREIPNYLKNGVPQIHWRLDKTFLY
jgi:hypothetical protein